MAEDLAIEDQIIAVVRRIIRAVDLHSRVLMERSGLTGPQLAVLREIRRLGPRPAGDLARASHLSQATVTGILDRLERRGLLTRTRSGEDRRSVIVDLTEAGQGLVERAPSLLQDRFRQELLRLREWERTSILATLQRIAAMMEAEEIEAAPVLYTSEELGGAAPDKDGPRGPADVVARVINQGHGE